MNKSPFLDKERILENKCSFAIYDGFPISKGHTLVIPKKIVVSIFDLGDEEYRSLFALARNARKFLKDKYNPDGFNFGINDGSTAGQTIEHAHLHIIPRYSGDLEDPRGGVRNILPDNSGYL